MEVVGRWGCIASVVGCSGPLQAALVLQRCGSWAPWLGLAAHRAKVGVTCPAVQRGVLSAPSTAATLLCLAAWCCHDASAARASVAAGAAAPGSLMLYASMELFCLQLVVPMPPAMHSISGSSQPLRPDCRFGFPERCHCPMYYVVHQVMYHLSGGSACKHLRLFDVLRAFATTCPQNGALL